MAERFANDAYTTLDGGINDSVTSLEVADSTLFPTTGDFRIRIDDEFMLVTAVSGTTWTVTRAVEGMGVGSGVAASHADGATIRHVLTSSAITAAINAAAYPLDTAPAFANAMDDEFAGASLDAKWTADASWTAATAATFAYSEIRKEFPVAASGSASRMIITQPIPSGDWEIACKLAHYSTANASTASADNPMIGLWLMEAGGTGAGIASYNSTVQEGYVWWRIVANAFNTRAGYSTYRQLNGAEGQFRPQWYRVRRTSGVYWGSVSLNGRDWLPEFQYTGTAFTPTVIGIGKMYNTPGAGRMWFDWFRRLV